MKSNHYEPVLDSDVQDAIGTVAIVDVRPASYFEAGHIPESVNIPFDVIAAEEGDLADNIVAAFKDAGYNEDDEFIVSCQTGYHSKLACDALFDAGYTNVKYYPGSYEDWVLVETHPVEK